MAYKLQNIEFQRTQDRSIIYQQAGGGFVKLTEKDPIVVILEEKIKTEYPEAYAALDKEYSKSRRPQTPSRHCERIPVVQLRRCGRKDGHRRGRGLQLRDGKLSVAVLQVSGRSVLREFQDQHDEAAAGDDEMVHPLHEDGI